MPSYRFFLPSNTIDRHVAAPGSPQELRGPQGLSNAQAMTCKSSFSLRRIFKYDGAGARLGISHSLGAHSRALSKLKSRSGNPSTLTGFGDRMPPPSTVPSTILLRKLWALSLQGLTRRWPSVPPRLWPVNAPRHPSTRNSGRGLRFCLTQHSHPALSDDPVTEAGCGLRLQKQLLAKWNLRLQFPRPGRESLVPRRNNSAQGPAF